MCMWRGSRAGWTFSARPNSVASVSRSTTGAEYGQVGRDLVAGG
jgi:hypothetical protein